MKITLIVIISVLALYIVAIYFYKRRLIDMRDNADFTTVRGKALINACNKKLDFINGYGIFKRRAD